MVDRIRNIPQAESFSSREYTLATRPPIALIDFANGKAPSRDKRDLFLEAEGVYDDIAKMPLHVLSATTSDGDKDFMVIGPRLTAYQTNALFHFAAPDKSFGLDSNDLENDWKNLNEDPGRADLLMAHATMDGWKYFEGSRKRILDMFERNYTSTEGFSQKDPDDVIVPVLRWKRNSDEERSLLLDPLEPALQSAIVQSLKDSRIDPNRLDFSMGTVLLAAYSQDQTCWLPVAHYQRGSTTGPYQYIGSSQVLAYILRNVIGQQEHPGLIPPDEDIQKSPLLEGFETYLETGQVVQVSL